MAKKISDNDFQKYFNDPEFRNKNRLKDNKKISRWNYKKIFLAGFLLLFLAGSIYIYSGLPSLEELENPRPMLASKVFTSDGELLGQFFIENRIETNIDSLPGFVTDALISTEDRKFFDHWGVDLGRFFKAMLKNVFTFSREGASTITQQLAKNLYQLKEGRENLLDTGVRKIREWLTAIQIEKNFTKEEILELYLNVSNFGRSAYGIESAAKVYFNKKASELTLPEAAVFIALLKSPEYYDPVKNYENSLARRNLVMYNMVVTGKLDEKEYEALKQQPIVLTSGRISGVKSEAPYFMEYVRQQMTALATKHGFDFYRDGINIYTSLDMRMQKIANRVAAEHIKKYQELFDKNWNWDKNKTLLASLIDQAIKNNPHYISASSDGQKAKIYNQLKNRPSFVDSVKKDAATVEVGFVVIDPANGQIKAMVGGENQEFGRGLNHVTGIKRQPGSSFKPFVYATALENGYYPAYTLLNQKFNYNGWSPDNADNDYTGYETLRWALANSVNVITGRMTISEIAPPNQVIRLAQRMGVKSTLAPYPSIGLGTSELTPLEITSAFGTFVNKGVHVDPISILKIEDRNGVMLEQFTPDYTEALSPQSASIMVDMMQDVINYGTGAGVRRYFQYPAAGKTGTTQNFSDAWFVGYTPQLVGGVWVGFDDHRVKFTNWYGQGAKAALPIWAMFMEAAYKELKIPLQYFDLDGRVVQATFCRETMNLGDPRIATDNCPETYTDIINEKYLPAICEIHNGGGKIKREDQSGETSW
ncbi:MAG TPA: PBP1A family penicillin-binding protein [Ignavibacteriaceae bacterium]|nr:PBP1A family penicillin-binding protein [Ignavibacteriaceae bacterium]